MQEEEPGSVRNDLLDRLRALESSQSQSGMAELAYKRAREALERALEEARVIRLQAIDDARLTREQEMSSLMDSLRSLRQSAESQLQTLLTTAEIEAARIRDNAAHQAHEMIERAGEEAMHIRTEAIALRDANEARMKEVDRLEAEFNRLVAAVAERLGISEKPPEGWWKRITSKQP